MSNSVNSRNKTDKNLILISVNFLVILFYFLIIFKMPHNERVLFLNGGLSGEDRRVCRDKDNELFIAPLSTTSH
jgi:hypothetical protein